MFCHEACYEMIWNDLSYETTSYMPLHASHLFHYSRVFILGKREVFRRAENRSFPNWNEGRVKPCLWLFVASVISVAIETRNINKPSQLSRVYLPIPPNPWTASATSGSRPRWSCYSCGATTHISSDPACPNRSHSAFGHDQRRANYNRQGGPVLPQYRSGLSPVSPSTN